jgi:tetratricopeptide (TPR) repeat protein
MKSRIYLSIFCLLMFCVNLSFAASPAVPAEFLPIVGLLQDKKWDQASVELEKLLTQFPRDSHILYDLGRVHFEKKEYAKALGYFRRSLQENPWETSALQGIQASEKALDLRSLPQDLEIQESLHKYFFQRAPLEFFLFLTLLSWIFLLWFLLGWIQQRRQKSVTIVTNIFLAVVTLLAAFSVFFSFAKYQDTKTQRSTVLVASVNVLMFPGKDQLIVYSLQQGHEVIVLQQQDGWVFVQYPGRSAGWIPKESLFLF